MNTFSRQAPDPGAGSKLESLRQELAELTATLAQLEKEVKRASRPRPARNSPKPATAPIAAETKSTVASPAIGAESGVVEIAPTPPLAAPAPPARTDDLTQPKSFGSLPPFAIFDDVSLPPEELRKKLTKALPYAMQVLHTSGVRAEIWREWRAFEKAIRAKLAAAAGTPPPGLIEGS